MLTKIHSKAILNFNTQYKNLHERIIVYQKKLNEDGYHDNAHPYLKEQNQKFGPLFYINNNNKTDNQTTTISFVKKLCIISF
ncbi:hypothetical protein F8M41_007569 [Gigaspora margarita]|uniref:Uncharacterized protein n=1 Tax=Gigaspora margarita TaxID=4874 RepID=A0A8H4A394_GIGMA|nr:hypothetical protein F8M41_007569 [Gigaspora margarita]